MKNKRRRKHPRVKKIEENNREQIIENIKEDLNKRFKHYHLSLLKIGASYTEIEDYIIKEIFNDIAKSYGLGLTEKRLSDAKKTN